MKTFTKRNLLTATLTIIMFLLGTCTAWASEYNGSLDGMEGTSISGWACNTSSPNTSANVQILVKNRDTKETTHDFTVFASEKRTDINNDGKLNDYCGFTADVDFSSHPEGTYDIEAFVDGKRLPNTLQYKKTADGDSVTQIAENQPVQAVQTASAGAGASKLNLKSLGSFRLTGYCKCRICCGKWSSVNSTFSGAVPRINHTIAVDPRVIPFGTKVMINGVIYTAEDKGSGVKGKHIDIFCASHSAASRIGGRAEVFLVQ